MKPLTLIIGALVANSVIASHSWAQTGKELDITMTIVDESDSPSVIINRIELPPVSALIAPAATAPSSSAADSGLTNALDQVQDDLQQTTGDLLNTTDDVLTNTINDTLSTGDLEQLPSDIIDNLPDELPEDLLPIPTPGDLTPKPGDVIDNPLDQPLTNPLGSDNSATPMENSTDAVLENLEQAQPATLEQIPEPNLPQPEGEQLLNDITDPLTP